MKLRLLQILSMLVLLVPLLSACGKQASNFAGISQHARNLVATVDTAATAVNVARSAAPDSVAVGSAVGNNINEAASTKRTTATFSLAKPGSVWQWLAAQAKQPGHAADERRGTWALPPIWRNIYQTYINKLQQVQSSSYVSVPE